MKIYIRTDWKANLKEIEVDTIAGSEPVLTRFLNDCVRKYRRIRVINGVEEFVFLIPTKRDEEVEVVQAGFSYNGTFRLLSAWNRLWSYESNEPKEGEDEINSYK